MSQEPQNKNSSNPDSGTENQGWDSARMASPFACSMAFQAGCLLASDVVPRACHIFFRNFLKSSPRRRQTSLFLGNRRLSRMPCLLRLCAPWAVVARSEGVQRWVPGLGASERGPGTFPALFQPPRNTGHRSAFREYSFTYLPSPDLQNSKEVPLQTQTSYR